MLVSNNRKLKKLIYLLVCCFLFICLSSKVYAVVEPTKEFYVNDYANILDSQTEQYIISVNRVINSKTGAQIVVVTVPNLEGNSLEEYATEVFRKFGIGDKTKNNGLLLLLALEERQFRVEVGYGLEGILPDAKTGRMQDEYIIPYLRENDWDNGIRNGFNAFVEEIKNEYGVSLDTQKAISVGSEYQTFAKVFSQSMNFAIIFYIIGTILRITNKNKRNKSVIIGVILIILDIIVRIVLGITIITVILDILAIIIGLLGGFFTGGFYGGRFWSEVVSAGGSFGGGGFSGGGGSSRRRPEVQEAFRFLLTLSYLSPNSQKW